MPVLIVLGIIVFSIIYFFMGYVYLANELVRNRARLNVDKAKKVELWWYCNGDNPEFFLEKEMTNEQKEENK